MKRELVVKSLTLEDYVDHIRAKEPFALARYGDGEWAAILGHEGENCDGHEYFPLLGMDLRAALDARSTYYLGLGGVALMNLGDQIRAYINNRNLYDRNWVEVDTFYKASYEGRLFPLVAALRRAHILYVGPERLFEPMNRTLFTVDGCVGVPLKNAYLQKEKIFKKITRKLESGSYEIVGFSAGMLSNVLIADLWPRWKQRVSLIDFGSLWDIYCGYPTRKYMHDAARWQWLAPKNLGTL